MRYAVWILLVGFVVVSGCSCSNSSSSYSTLVDKEEVIVEAENPYDEGSGHSAGYEWAKENEVDSCGGVSQSFIDGCEEYVRQRDEQVGSDEYDDNN